MRDADLVGFDALMKRLRVLRRMEDGELAGLTASYFRALRRFELGDLERGADRWLERETFFPKPAELAEYAQQARRPPVSPLPMLTEAEAHEWLRAERLRYEDTPCRCSECQAHGVAESPRRFVPLFDNNDRAMQCRIGDRIVTRGEWIHGAALMRYYVAKERCYTDNRSPRGQMLAKLIGAGR